MSQTEIVIIAAVGVENRVIGVGQDLPWHIPEDLKRFKALTHGHPILMGHRTFESLVHQFGGPLKGRRNLVLSVSAAYPEYDNVEVYPDMKSAIAAAAECDTLFVGGGAMVYAEFLPIAHRLELTLVEGHHEGDVFFPPYEHLIGPLYALDQEDRRDGFRFATYVRCAVD